MFNKEELKELKYCVNNMIVSRQTYKTYEDSESRLNDNDKFLDLDYRLVEKILNLLKEVNDNEVFKDSF